MKNLIDLLEQSNKIKGIDIDTLKSLLNYKTVSDYELGLQEKECNIIKHNETNNVTILECVTTIFDIEVPYYIPKTKCEYIWNQYLKLNHKELQAIKNMKVSKQVQFSNKSECTKCLLHAINAYEDGLINIK